MNTAKYLQKIKSNPEQLEFQDLIQLIDTEYLFTPTRFQNGNTTNEAGQNSGSCKLFSFARLHALTKEETLACFGKYYQIDVLQYPENTDHQNIRHFMLYGWEGIKFDSEALRAL
jgi:hypothetical protein